MLRIAVFVDGNNVFHVGKKLGFSIDYGKLSDFLKKKFHKNGGEVVIRRFFTGSPENLTENQENFWKKLEEIGYEVIKRDIKEIVDPISRKTIKKADMDATIGFSMADSQREFDLLVLISGDGDYELILKNLAKRGKKIVVISTKGFVASELIDLSRPSHGNIRYIDLASIKDQIFYGNRCVPHD